MCSQPRGKGDLSRWIRRMQSQQCLAPEEKGMSEELHPLCLRHLRVIVWDLASARAFPVSASPGRAWIWFLPTNPTCAVLRTNFFNLTPLSGEFVTASSSLLPALKHSLG